MRLSRRQFLGVVGAVASIHPAIPLASVRQFGRTLSPLSINNGSTASSGSSPFLLANSPLELLGKRGDAFITPLGDVPRIALQPMPRYQRARSSITIPNVGIVEVIHTHAPLYQYASHDSQFLGDIGHGGVLHLIDRLSDTEEDWIHLADVDQRPLGWSPMQSWGDWKRPRSIATGEWVLNRKTHQLILSGVSTSPILVAINYPHSLPSGTFPFTVTQQGGHTLANRMAVPCLGTLDTPQGEVLVHGVYWHNNFKSQHDSRTIEVSIEGLRWLQATLTNANVLRII